MLQLERAMKLKRKSYFRNPKADKNWCSQWVSRLEAHNGKKYEHIQLKTILGITHVWHLNPEKSPGDCLVIFSGERTTGLFWDLDNALAGLARDCCIFIVETNGQTNLSEGFTTELHDHSYGKWAAEVIQKLGIDRANIAGSGFGALVCMKLALYAKDRVKSMFLLNPAGVETPAKGRRNLAQRLWPSVFSSRENVMRYMENVYFSKPTHALPEVFEELAIDYHFFSLLRHSSSFKRGYTMIGDLKKLDVETYLFLGENDTMYPHKQMLAHAQKRFGNLKELMLLPAGHGLETYAPMADLIRERISVSVPA